MIVTTNDNKNLKKLAQLLLDTVELGEVQKVLRRLVNKYGKDAALLLLSNGDLTLYTGDEAGIRYEAHERKQLLGETKSVLQEWVLRLSLMQQSVLLTAVRGPDGLEKYGCVKMLLRWYRRCVLVSAFDKKVLDHPADTGGGSFTGPSIGYAKRNNNWIQGMDDLVGEYLQKLDAIPHHFQMHFLHAVEILGYKHTNKTIRNWWGGVYVRLVNDLHLHPETEDELDERLGDTAAGWKKRADKATQK